METKNDKLPPASPRIALVCVGKSYMNDGEIGVIFQEVTEGGSLGNERIYSVKKLKHMRAGSVYEVEYDPAKPTSIYVDTIRWRCLWHDKKQAAVWQATTDAFDTRELALKQERKETRRKLFMELLAPLREAYWSTNAAGRLAIEVRVLAYLRQDPLTANGD